MRVLISGASGALGRTLVRQCSADGDEVIATRHRAPVEAPDVRVVDVDLLEPDAIAELVDAERPQVVFHTAYGHDDWTLTAVTPGLLAAACATVGARMVHVSSDAVFSGRKACYVEVDQPDPVNPYGAAKAAAEVAVRLALPSAAIVRTSLILGHDEAPMEVLARGLATGERDGALFTDDIRCPVHVDDLASAIRELCVASGVFHVAGSDALSRMDMARAICDREGLPHDRLRPALRADLPVPGPLDLRLDSCETRRHLSTRLRGAREFLA